MGGAWLASWGKTCTVLVFPNGRDTESCFLAAIKLPNMVVTLPVVSQPRSLLCFAQASKQANGGVADQVRAQRLDTQHGCWVDTKVSWAVSSVKTLLKAINDVMHVFVKRWLPPI